MHHFLLQAATVLGVALHAGAAAIGQGVETTNVARAASDYEGYLFAYFTGDTLDGEKIYFAASNGNNALDWDELHDGNSVLQSTQGTRGVRDPFLIRSPDGGTFYLLATDLSIGSGTSWDDAQRHGSRYLEVWNSTDLIHWGQQRHILVSPREAGMTWSPQAYYDAKAAKYVVYWASALYNTNDTDHTGDSYDRMMYATTKDFISFTPARVWQDTGKPRLDSSVIMVNDTYYRFSKDQAASSPCVDIVQESSKNIYAQVQAWTVMDTCIGQNAGTGPIEGPAIFKSNPDDVNGDKYYLFVDEYTGRGYVPLETADITKPDWKISANFNLPNSPRHGNVLPITADELQRVKTAYGPKNETRSYALIPGLYADPNIAIFNGTDEYYLYGTTDGFPGWSGDVFYVWKSADVRNWTRSAEPILTLNGTNGNVPWATGNAWAPTIATRNGKYYFYFSGENPTYNWKTIGAAVADSPDGPFVAQPTAMITNTESITTNQAIDPCSFYDPKSGKYFMYWGNGNPLMAELNPDMVSLKPNSIRAVQGLTDFREGSFMVYRAPYYHLTYSIDDTGSENYRVGYATARNPNGPFMYRGVILEKDISQGILGTGHNSIVNVPGTDDWYIAYHRFAMPNGDGQHRETTVDRLYFDGITGLIIPVVPTLKGPPAETISQ